MSHVNELTNTLPNDYTHISIPPSFQVLNVVSLELTREQRESCSVDMWTKNYEKELDILLKTR